jgi:hypothetical protein
LRQLVGSVEILLVKQKGALAEQVVWAEGDAAPGRQTHDKDGPRPAQPEPVVGGHEQVVDVGVLFDVTDGQRAGNGNHAHKGQPRQQGPVRQRRRPQPPGNRAAAPARVDDILATGQGIVAITGGHPAGYELAGAQKLLDLSGRRRDGVEITMHLRCGERVVEDVHISQGLQDSRFHSGLVGSRRRECAVARA